MNPYKDVLLCCEDTIKTYTNLNDNTAGKYILPALYIAQHQNLEEVLGTLLVEKLQELVATNHINDNENEHYKVLLDDYVNDFLAYSTIVKIIPIVSFKIGNLGATRTEDEKVTGMSYSEVFGLAQHYQQQVDYLQYRMQKYLLQNYSKYKELKEHTTTDNLKSNLISASNCNIWLGGARNKILI